MAPDLPMLRFPAKQIRAAVVADYMAAAGYGSCVCFSCGNAATALRRAGVEVLEIGPRGRLTPNGWWQPEQVRRVWPDRFDATPGHLPAFLMLRIGLAFRDHLGASVETEREWAVPTGSGETITCLRWAYPDTRFRALRDLDEATAFDPEAPLNRVVAAMGG